MNRQTLAGGAVAAGWTQPVEAPFVILHTQRIIYSQWCVLRHWASLCGDSE